MSFSISSTFKNLLVLALALKAYKSSSLTPLGIAASIITGLIHTHTPSPYSWLPFSLLASFYITSSRFTKLKAEIKAQLTQHASGDSGGEGPRNATQVFANSIVASILIILYTLAKILYQDQSFISNNSNNNNILQTFSQTFYTEPQEKVSPLIIGIIAHYCAVSGDTWSSELGILSQSPPRLITTWKVCPRGTNGGVSTLGLGVAFGAGTMIGLVSSLSLYIVPAFIYSNNIASVIDTAKATCLFTLLCSFLGLFGSMLDSLMGALLQESIASVDKNVIIEGLGGGKISGNEKSNWKYKVVSGKNILSNNQVNLMTSVITSLVGMAIWACFF